MGENQSELFTMFLRDPYASLSFSVSRGSLYTGLFLTALPPTLTEYLSFNSFGFVDRSTK